MSKHPSHKEKVNTQEEKATGGVALGFEDQCLGIWAKGVTLSPTLKKTHLGLDSIYKPKSAFVEKDQIPRKEGNMEGSARVWRPMLLDLCQWSHF